MKKILLAVAMFFAFISVAFAAVNLNTATKEELDAVKGIGPVKAQAIVDYRQKNGSFKSVDDLKNVKGFGEKTVEKMRSDLTVSGASSSSKKADVKSEEKPAKAEKKEEAKSDKKEVKADKQEAKTDKKDAKDDKKESKAEKKAAKKAAKEAKEAKKDEKK